MAFDFRPPPESPPLTYPITPGHLAASGQREPAINRFVKEVPDKIQIRTPADAARYLQERIYTPWSDFDQEALFTLLLDTKSRVTHEALVYRGTVNRIDLRLAEVFKPAVQVNAPAILLSHNHPSGLPDPSPEDVRMTEAAHQAGQLLGIDLVDHLIVAREGWVSLKEKGLGFGSLPR
jgi:DNA repair protein RadC